ncbi:flagellar basal body P-ring formation protein FlgA [Oxalobacteraceae bacterium CAVE-383]|nr:flagellar basal body P-ring formation protein FlgA [Oxalobacteraceae bacterium CAVE-383]
MKSFVIKVLPLIFNLLLLSAAGSASAQGKPPANPPISAPDSDLPANARQDLSALSPVIEHFLAIQATGSQNKISVELGRIDPRLNLAACPAPEAFLPKGSRAFGKTMVGVRCAAPVAWSIYVPVTVRVRGDYYVTAGSLAQGQVIGPQDLSKANGDLTTLPAGVITDPAQAIGRMTSMAMRAGVPLRQDELRSQLVVRQGQSVKVVSNGPGFQISTEAVATSNAVEGQIAQAKTATGQTVSGVAKAGGILEINN